DGARLPRGGPAGGRPAAAGRPARGAPVRPRLGAARSLGRDREPGRAGAGPGRLLRPRPADGARGRAGPRHGRAQGHEV
ncbi:MAG: hypothetical protein AVDCRST_MAG49-4373, partial [uncultured Thermomicrobiales bacterium]